MAKYQIVGNKAKGRISKRVFQENMFFQRILIKLIMITKLLFYNHKAFIDIFYFKSTFWNVLAS